MNENFSGERVNERTSEQTHNVSIDFFLTARVSQDFLLISKDRERKIEHPSIFFSFFFFSTADVPKCISRNAYHAFRFRLITINRNLDLSHAMRATRICMRNYDRNAEVRNIFHTPLKTIKYFKFWYRIASILEFIFKNAALFPF